MLADWGDVNRIQPGNNVLQIKRQLSDKNSTTRKSYKVHNIVSIYLMLNKEINKKGRQPSAINYVGVGVSVHIIRSASSSGNQFLS
jgi:hypothetical protein